MDIKFNRGKLLSGIVYPEFFPISKKDIVLNIGCGDGVQSIVYKGEFKKMIGVDINLGRLKVAKQLTAFYNMPHFTIIQANAENIPLNEKFDKIIAIDLIEHVINPEKVAEEIYRLLKDDGRALITFPSSHDKWENLFRFIGRKILRRKGKTVYKPGWDPDQHQYNYNLKTWINIFEKTGFNLLSSRGSTLFPPLHYLGLPRFWFSNRYIHFVDNYLCKLPVLKNLGQSLLCIFYKSP